MTLILSDTQEEQEELPFLVVGQIDGMSPRVFLDVLDSAQNCQNGYHAKLQN